MFITVEMIPVLLGMAVVVPLTFDVIRSILEDRLDFDVMINLTLLRIIEAVIAIWLFPSALVYTITISVYGLSLEVFSISKRLVDYLRAPRIIEALYYYFTILVTFLGIHVAVINCLKFIYNSL